jgi:hypothetical protein
MFVQGTFRYLQQNAVQSGPIPLSNLTGFIILQRRALMVKMNEGIPASDWVGTAGRRDAKIPEMQDHELYRRILGIEAPGLWMQ